MAYRPQYKDKNGNIVDLPLDADTVRGKEVYSKEETDARIDEKLDEKQITEVNCSHEVEITGFGEEDCNLVIDDQDVVITKIQGQTRRKSLNLWKGGNLSYTVEYDGYQVFDVANIDAMVGDTITIKFKSSTYTDVLKILTAIGKEGYVSNINGVYTLTFTLTSGSNKLFYISGHVGDSISFNDIQINEGTTALPYEPYDNTLVNSKCDFVSTGRNLFDKNTYKLNSLSVNITSDGIELTNATTNYSFINYNITSLPDGTYTLSFNAKYGSNTPYLNLYSNGDNVIKISTSNSITFTKSGDMNILFYIARNSQSGYLTITNLMLNYGDTALPYEPYVEDTMQCGLELGQWDYHDNVNHITHRQTGYETLQSIIDKTWTLEGAGSTSGYKFWCYVPNAYAIKSDKLQLVVNNSNLVVRDNIDTAGGIRFAEPNRSYSQTRLFINVSNDVNTVDKLKAWFSQNNIAIQYKLANETTEENILPSGYKVWYKGMQVQKTDTIPYILTKQYAISLASQVLNNVSIDRSQQKQIDELKTISENKANASDLGGFKFEKNGNVNTMYVESDLPLISNYDKETSTQATVVGNIDSGLLLCSAQTRPKFTNGFTTSEIALLEDIPHLFIHQISFSESALSYVSFEIILSYPTAINTKDKIKAILTDNYYTSIQRPKIAIGMSAGQGYFFDAIYINNGELFARELTTTSLISIEGICVSIEDKITQKF